MTWSDVAAHLDSANDDGTSAVCDSPAASHADGHLDGARLRAARTRFADSLDTGSSSASLGEITLRADQLRALRRVVSQLTRDAGCVLADDVGTGKTYVALAVAREWRRPLIVVPASLRPTWRDAVRRAGIQCEMVSHESLSRGVLPVGDHDGIIVDESHRFRPTARRHAALARLAARAQLLLLSATPLQNRTRELAAQIALFVGDAAYRLESSALARYVVRGAVATTLALPRVAPPRWLAVQVDDGDVLRAILALPPPPRALDAGDGGALLTLSLVRAWASSRAALVATVRRRRQTLAAMEQCLEEGRAPTRGELRSWRGGGGVQLGFASLLAATSVEAAAVGEITRALEAERRGLDALLASLDATRDPDIARVAALLAVRAAHSSASILCFSESASTIRAYHSALRAVTGVGMLTARDARIATGRLPRAELLARFAPKAQGAPTPASHERVTLLLATDLLSEGVNLQDASVVVHLDLPWNPARLAQRMGRVRRPGGADEVHGYLMSPPADAALLLRTEARLRAKLARAERTIGRGLHVVPTLGVPRVDSASTEVAASRQAPEHQSADAELRGDIDARLTSWARRRDVASGRVPPRRCITAAVACDAHGWVACLDDGRIVAALRERGEAGGASSITDRARAVTDDAHIVTDDARIVSRSLELADGRPRIAAEDEGERARRAITAHLARGWTQRSAGLVHARPHLREIALRRLDRILAAAPRHRRRELLDVVARLRSSLDAPLPLGVERALAEESPHSGPSTTRGPANADSFMESDDEWLATALALVERAPPRAAECDVTRPASLVALILLGPH